MSGPCFALVVDAGPVNPDRRKFVGVVQALSRWFGALRVNSSHGKRLFLLEKRTESVSCGLWVGRLFAGRVE